MKAAICQKYGPPDVVRIEEVEKPEPKDNEILIKIRATTVTAGDWRMRSANMPAGFGLIARLVLGVFKPRRPILGSELSGEVEAVGKDVSKFRVGDQVFAFPAVDPGFGVKYVGCHAEYRTMPQNGRVVLKPANLSAEESAAISFGGTTALHYLRDKGRIRPNDRVLIIGASGAVGSAAVQLAKHFGAYVVALCSAGNFEQVKAIGADRAIDYAKEDFTRGGDTFDIILDTVGETSFAKYEDSLKPGGRLLLVAADLAQTLDAAFGSKRDNKKAFAGSANVATEDLLFLKQLAEAGQFKPLIDSCYPLERIVEAHARVETRRKRGSVVVVV